MSRPVDGRSRLVVALGLVFALGFLVATSGAVAWASLDLFLVAKWWMVVVLVGIIVSPLTQGLTHHFPDRGIAVNQMIGLVATTYVAWLSGSLHVLPYNRTSPWLWVVIVAVISAGSILLLGTRLGPPSRGEIGRWLGFQIIFAAIFVAFLLVEAHNPRTPFHFGDQGLDSAMVNSLARANWFPPPDPWLSGWKLNYYYLGYLVQSILARLTGTQSSIAYSVGMVTVITLTSTISLSTGWAIARRWWGGALAALVIGLGNNLDLSRMALESGRIVGLDVAHSTSLVEQTFSDPPFVTFTLGELHPQFLALPTIALLCAIIYALMTVSRRGMRPAQRWLNLAIAGVVLGLPGLTNLYSLPEALGLWVMAYAFLWMRNRKRWVVVDCALGLGISVVGYLPFWLSYEGNPQSRIMVNPIPTSPFAIVMLFGMFLFPLSLWALFAVDWTKRGKSRERMSTIPVSTILAALVMVVVLLGLVGVIPHSGFGIYLAGFILCVERSFATARRKHRIAEGFCWVAAAMSFGGLAGIELVSIDVPTTTVTMRFNIAWKTYLSVWIPLGLATSGAIADLVNRLDGQQNGFFRRLGGGIGATLVLLAAAAGVLYSMNAMNGLREQHGFDGLSYIQTQPQSEKDDLAAIKWLNLHAGDGDVVLEATGGPAHPYMRISSYTGLTTIVGWPHAVDAWHGSPMTVRQRLNDVATMYGNHDVTQTRALLATYKVRYVVIGAFEESVYATVDRAGLERIAATAFRQGSTEILETPVVVWR